MLDHSILNVSNHGIRNLIGQNALPVKRSPPKDKNSDNHQKKRKDKGRALFNKDGFYNIFDHPGNACSCSGNDCDQDENNYILLPENPKILAKHAN